MQGWHCPKRWTIARKPSPSPYLPRKASSCVRKLFDWSSQGSNSHHLRDEGGRSGWSPFSHNTNHPFPEGKKRLVLFRLYPDIHLLVKVFCHLCERETLSKKKKKNKTKKKEGKEGSNKENGHSFFSSIAIARRTKAEGLRPKQWQAKVCGSTRFPKSSIVFTYSTVAFLRLLYLLLSFGRFLTTQTQQTGKLATIIYIYIYIYI